MRIEHADEDGLRGCALRGARLANLDGADDDGDADDEGEDEIDADDSAAEDDSDVEYDDDVE